MRSGPACCSLRILLGTIAVLAVSPATAHETTHQAPAPVQRGSANTQPAADSLDSIVVIGGATDPRQERWARSDAKKPLLPVIPEDASLEEESTEASETPRER